MTMEKAIMNTASWGVDDEGRDIPVQNSSSARDIPAHDMQAVRILQYKIVSQQGHSSTRYAGSKDTPVQNSQSAGTFQHTICRQ
jgi:hypothetical protein